MLLATAVKLMGAYFLCVNLVPCVGGARKARGAGEKRERISEKKHLPK